LTQGYHPAIITATRRYEKGTNDMKDRALEEKEILSPNELLEILPIGRTKLYSELYSGSLKSSKVGRRRLIKKADVWRWLEENR
jgi:excisionase family DNA binding protein